MSVLGVEGVTNFTNRVVGARANTSGTHSAYGTGISRIELGEISVGAGATGAAVTMTGVEATDILLGTIQESGTAPAANCILEYVFMSGANTVSCNLNKAPGDDGTKVNVLLIRPSAAATPLTRYTNLKVGAAGGDASAIQQINVIRDTLVDGTTSKAVSVPGLGDNAHVFVMTNEDPTTGAVRVQELTVDTAADTVTVENSAAPGGSHADFGLLAIEGNPQPLNTGLTAIQADTTNGTPLTEILIAKHTITGQTNTVSMPGLTTDHKLFVSHSSEADDIWYANPTADTATVKFTADSSAEAGVIWVLAVKQAT